MFFILFFLGIRRDKTRYYIFVIRHIGMLYVIKKIEEKYQKEESTLIDELHKVADLIASKHYNYRKGSSNYKYSIETIVNELHSNIFKYCENVVRENFGHKRKLNVEIAFAKFGTSCSSRGPLKTKNFLKKSRKFF